MSAFLRNKWNELLACYAPPEERAEKLWQEITTAYGQEDRHYHNLDHLADLLALAEKYRSCIEDWSMLVFAIWYHDIVYQVTRHDNEARSAELAGQRLRELGITRDRIGCCREMILATKHHQAPGNLEIEDLKWLLDFDLSILGSAPEQYYEYTRQIREEYRIFPSLLYRRGRRKALESFLARERIFRTDPCFEAYEAQARRNMEWELGVL